MVVAFLSTGRKAQGRRFVTAQQAFLCACHGPRVPAKMLSSPQACEQRAIPLVTHGLSRSIGMQMSDAPRRIKSSKERRKRPSESRRAFVFDRVLAPDNRLTPA